MRAVIARLGVYKAVVSATVTSDMVFDRGGPTHNRSLERRGDAERALLQAGSRRFRARAPGLHRYDIVAGGHANQSIDVALSGSTHMTIEQRLLHIAGKLWPDLGVLDTSMRKQIISEVIGIIYGALLMVLGISWLVLVTDLALVGAEWPTLVLMLILAAALNQLDFFW